MKERRTSREATIPSAFTMAIPSGECPVTTRRTPAGKSVAIYEPAEVRKSTMSACERQPRCFDEPQAIWLFPMASMRSYALCLKRRAGCNCYQDFSPAQRSMKIHAMQRCARIQSIVMCRVLDTKLTVHRLEAPRKPAASGGGVIHIYSHREQR